MSSPRRVALGNHLGKRSDIAQTGIQALAGNRVHPMRGVSDQRHAVTDEAVGDGQVQRISEAFAGQGDLTQKIAEPRPQRLDVFCIRQRVDGLGCLCPLAPHDGGPVARQRQDGQRPGRHEELMGNAKLCGFSWSIAQTSAVWPVIPAGPLDACAPLRSAAAAPVRADQNLAAQLAAVIQRDGHACGVRRLCPPRCGPNTKRDPRRILHRLQEGAAQVGGPRPCTPSGLLPARHGRNG